MFPAESLTFIEYFSHRPGFSTATMGSPLDMKAWRHQGLGDLAQDPPHWEGVQQGSNPSCPVSKPKLQSTCLGHVLTQIQGVLFA